MERAIFEDLAWQHELYVMRGIDGLRRVNQGAPELLGQAGSQNSALLEGRLDTFGAWEDIASGDPTRVQRGNKALAVREQDTVLQPHYNDLLRFAPAMTSTISELAQSPISRNGTSFMQVEPNYFPEEKDHPLARPLRRSYKDRGLRMNVAYWEDRQVWFFRYLLPEYQELLSRPEAARAEAAIPVEVRAQGYRFPPAKKACDAAGLPL